jgi:hypothetical protein
MVDPPGMNDPVIFYLFGLKTRLMYDMYEEDDEKVDHSFLVGSGGLCRIL